MPPTIRRTAGPDGGNARGDRARATIADALIALIDEGNLHATAAEVAARAGVSERSIYFHFGDAETLFRAAGERRLQAIAAALTPIDPSLPLEERSAVFVKQRARLLEAITPMRRAALLKEPDSPAVAEGLRGIRRLKAAHACAVLAPELSALAAPEARIATAAVATAASWSTWEALRAHQGLSKARAQEVMLSMLRAIVASKRDGAHRTGRRSEKKA